MRERMKGIRSFVLQRLADIRRLLDSDPLAARLEIAKQANAIRLYPEGDRYRIEAS